MELKIKKLDPKARLPKRGSDGAAGVDLHALYDYGILIGDTVKIQTGIAVEIPEGYFGAIFARSGLATKQGLRPANAVGVIDQDYRGEIIVALHNDSFKNRIVCKGDRIAQMVLIPYLPIDVVEADELSETERGDGGFGSTGVS